MIETNTYVLYSTKVVSSPIDTTKIITVPKGTHIQCASILQQAVVLLGEGSPHVPHNVILYQSVWAVPATHNPLSVLSRYPLLQSSSQDFHIRSRART